MKRSPTKWICLLKSGHQQTSALRGDKGVLQSRQCRHRQRRLRRLLAAANNNFIVERAQLGRTTRRDRLTALAAPFDRTDSFTHSCFWAVYGARQACFTYHTRRWPSAPLNSDNCILDSVDSANNWSIAIPVRPQNTPYLNGHCSETKDDGFQCCFV